jgi:hypothetical protein
MARYELLNNVAHKDLRVATHFGSEFGDVVGVVPAYPTEFAELQREYPIFFRKDPDGDGYQAVALLGFAPKENLFLDGNRWNAAYVPGHIVRGPFLIGFQEQQIDGELRSEPVIHVDVEHARVAAGKGEAVFLPQGGNSPYLERIITVLRGIRDGIDAGKSMFKEFDSLGLIQPVDLDVRLDDEAGVNLKGLHGIDRERLQSLDAESLHRLNVAGWLEGAYPVLASMHNIRRLMAEKQRRLREERGAVTGVA